MDSWGILDQNYAKRTSRDQSSGSVQRAARHRSLVFLPRNDAILST